MESMYPYEKDGHPVRRGQINRPKVGGTSAARTVEPKNEKDSARVSPDRKVFVFECFLFLFDEFSRN